ncbi:hypothetical protein SKDZ_04G0330 [Saccharomyces kudriavzevii ZP591]|nr:hypothetical protein SKDZ_04G0330 [Saccharomyces kudriavzevii ZP591]
MLLSVTSSRFVNRCQPTSLNGFDTSETCLSPLSAIDLTAALSTGTEAKTIIESLGCVISSIQDLSSTEFNCTSVSKPLVANYSSSVISNITLDRWLISSLKTFSSSAKPTIHPSTTEITTPLFTTHVTSATSETYSAFTDQKSIYVVYDQEYKITELTTTFNTHFPQTTVLKEAGALLTFTIPSNTITGDAKLYQVLSGELNVQNSPDKKNKKTGVIVGSTVGVIIGVVVIIFIGFTIIRNKRNVKNRSKKGFSHNIGQRISCDKVVAKGEPMSNPFLNEVNYKVVISGGDRRNLRENDRKIRRDNSSDSLFTEHPYYGTENREAVRFSCPSSYTESSGSSTEEMSSNASTITRPNIEQTNSFLREII